MTNLPIPVLNGIGVVGILLIVTWMIFTGRLVTRREADAKDRQIDAQREALALKDKTISDFGDSISTSNALTRALLEVARDQQRRNDGGKGST